MGRGLIPLPRYIIFKGGCIMNIGIIVGMAVATVASAITQKIFASVGKTDEAQYLDLATKSGLAVTALTVFASVIKAISRLG